MADLLLAVAATAVLAALGLALLAGLTLAPFVVALQLAERRRSPSVVWGALALAGSGSGLLLAAVVLRAAGPPDALAALPLLLTWLAPAVLRGGSAGRPLLGAAGRHA